MQSPATRHLIIPQGTSVIEPFQIVHSVRLTAAFVLSLPAPPSSISVYPLSIALPAGYLLVFRVGDKTVELTTAQPADIGAKSISIAPHTGTVGIPANSVAGTLPRDLTGMIWSGAVKADYRVPEKILQFTFDITPLSGLIIMRASYADTAQMRPNCTYEQLPPETRQQEKTAYDPAVWAKGYYWDAEYLKAGEIFRVFQGRLFVPAEATT
jgi:hypothetical protein